MNLIKTCLDEAENIFSLLEMLNYTASRDDGIISRFKFTQDLKIFLLFGESIAENLCKKMRKYFSFCKYHGIIRFYWKKV